MKLTTSSAEGVTTASNCIKTQHFVNDYGTFPMITTLVGWLCKVQRPTRHILGHFGDDVVTTASARIIAYPEIPTARLKQLSTEYIMTSY